MKYTFSVYFPPMFPASSRTGLGLVMGLVSEPIKEKDPSVRNRSLLSKIVESSRGHGHCAIK